MQVNIQICNVSAVYKLCAAIHSDVLVVVYAFTSYLVYTLGVQ